MLTCFLDRKNNNGFHVTNGDKMSSPPMLRIPLKCARCLGVSESGGWVPKGMGARIEGPRAG